MRRAQTDGVIQRKRWKPEKRGHGQKQTDDISREVISSYVTARRVNDWTGFLTVQIRTELIKANFNLSEYLEIFFMR